MVGGASEASALLESACDGGVAARGAAADMVAAAAAVIAARRPIPAAAHHAADETAEKAAHESTETVGGSGRRVYDLQSGQDGHRRARSDQIALEARLALPTMRCSLGDLDMTPNTTSLLLIFGIGPRPRGEHFLVDKIGVGDFVLLGGVEGQRQRLPSTSL